MPSRSGRCPRTTAWWTSSTSTRAGSRCSLTRVIGNARCAVTVLSFSCVLHCSFSAVSCELKAGEMLYMPAGYWHQVDSYCDALSSTGDDSETHHSEQQLIVALNFWWRPLPCHVQPHMQTYHL